MKSLSHKFLLRAKIIFLFKSFARLCCEVERSEPAQRNILKILTRSAGERKQSSSFWIANGGRRRKDNNFCKFILLYCYFHFLWRGVDKKLRKFYKNIKLGIRNIILDIFKIFRFTLNIIKLFVFFFFTQTWMVDERAIFLVPNSNNEDCTWERKIESIKGEIKSY